jgi:Kef-type K+ transport system membrane component KefB
MIDSPWLLAAVWMGLALAASLISIRTAISVALVEICLGCVAGNVLDLKASEWINFLASFGSVLLTFLAGAEIDPKSLRQHWKPALSIGFLSFLVPFAGAWAFAYWVLGWDPSASKIAGIALSTTSVAVVYAVMIETGLNRNDLGKLILAACFVTDLGTVLALGVMFAHYNIWLAVFLGASALIMPFAGKLTERFLKRYEGQVSEPEMKLLLLMLFAFGGLAALANSEAVLPAYILGLVVAGAFARHRETIRHIRIATFAMLTPFYFLKAGALVHIGAVWTGLSAIAMLLGVKMFTKFVGVYPVTRLFKQDKKTSIYTTLLMSTGLTFGSISAMFGLNRGLISEWQYSVLVTTVIASAVIPTLIAQRHFKPALPAISFESEDEAMVLTERAENANGADQSRPKSE